MTPTFHLKVLALALVFLVTVDAQSRPGNRKAAQTSRPQQSPKPTAAQVLKGGDEDDLTEECPEPNGYFADAYQCDKYYECIDGAVTEKLCPDGMVFNDFSPLHEKCDLPFNIDCSQRPDRQSPKPSLHCRRQNGYFSHEEENVCDKFYFCVDGKFNMIQCPNGLVYNENTGICTWPDEAKKKGCSSQGSSADQKTKGKFQLTKNKYENECRKAEYNNDGKNLLTVGKYHEQRKKRASIGKDLQSKQSTYFGNDNLGEQYFDTMKQSEGIEEDLYEDLDEPINDKVQNKTDDISGENDSKTTTYEKQENKSTDESSKEKEDDDIEKKADASVSETITRQQEIKREFENGIIQRIKQQDEDEEELKILLSDHIHELGKDYVLDIPGEDLDISRWTTYDDAMAEDIAID